MNDSGEEISGPDPHLFAFCRGLHEVSNWVFRNVGNAAGCGTGADEHHAITRIQLRDLSVPKEL